MTQYRQTDTSIGDWFYNRNWKLRKIDWVIHMLVDIVSKNGNLLLNVVQHADGSLDPGQLLKDLRTPGGGVIPAEPEPAEPAVP